MKPQTTNTRWNRAIELIIKFCDRVTGSKAAIVRRLEKNTGEKWYRQQVDGYLHADPAKRKQPLLGCGLALIEAAGQVMEEHRQAEWIQRIKDSAK